MLIQFNLTITKTTQTDKMETRWRGDEDEIEMKWTRDGDDCYINDKFEEGQGNRVELTWDMKKVMVAQILIFWFYL